MTANHSLSPCCFMCKFRANHSLSPCLFVQVKPFVTQPCLIKISITLDKFGYTHWMSGSLQHLGLPGTQCVNTPALALALCSLVGQVTLQWAGLQDYIWTGSFLKQKSTTFRQLPTCIPPQNSDTVAVQTRYFACKVERAAFQCDHSGVLYLEQQTS